MSANKQPAGSKTSKGRVDSTDAHREARGQGEKPPRAHRDDTTEAQQQREGMPKTHPTSAPTSSRKASAGRESDDPRQSTGLKPVSDNGGK